MRGSDGSQGGEIAPGSDDGQEIAFKGANGQIFATSSRNFAKNFKGKGKFFCDYCKLTNHTIDSCWKLHGKLRDKERKINQPISYDQYQQLMQALQKMDISNKGGSFSGISHCLINFISRKAWIIDSRASDYIICNKGFFSNINESLNYLVSIQLSNDTITHVKVTGTVNLSPQLVLQNVLYVPEFQFNLIYI